MDYLIKIVVLTFLTHYSIRYHALGTGVYDLFDSFLSILSIELGV
jgi:hypothetical protein